VIIFATSDKGGTGRSVTSCNLAYRHALHGNDVCYLDFDFGSPTAGAIFNLEDIARGRTGGGGLHDYLTGAAATAEPTDIWAHSDREGLHRQPAGAGRLVLLPGDEGGGEFPVDETTVDRCARLLMRLTEEFRLVLVDLSAGRSYALALVLAATAPRAESAGIPARWLVFHRWTRQHIIAAAGLAFGKRGIVEVGTENKHPVEILEESIRFVRTAVVTTDSPQQATLRPTQAAFWQDCDRDLRELAAKRRIGRPVLLGEIPLDPVLQMREQVITDADIFTSQIANQETGTAFEILAKKLTDDAAWETL
jgi:CobQ/CobB/MinD/ParA nucleotide binding domain